MIPSIFNDVIGPVMRGPSSSHCAAALRIGRLARDLMGGELAEVRVEFDRAGSLPTTHESQGSDMGLCGGLLGWDATDERLPESPRALRAAGVRVSFATVDADDPHPNTYRLSLRNARAHHSLIAVSTGGGMIEVIGIDGFTVSIEGDYHETLLWAEGDAPALMSAIRQGFEADAIVLHEGGTGRMIEVKAGRFVPDDIVAGVKVDRLAPVMPVASRKGMTVPFATCAEMMRHDVGRGTPLWKLAVEYEMARGGLTEPDIVARMMDIVRIVRRAIAQGIEGTRYADRILGPQAGQFNDRMQAGCLLDAGVLNRIILYVTALMEVKSALGVIVAAPTAGACAALPGTVVAMAEEKGLDDEAMAKAMLAGGIVGVFIATRWTFAAEVGGCQAECGAAACMAAAALVTLANGTAEESVAAASLALQGMIGLVCDPVAGRVEVPCLGKNVMAAAHALSCANMALAGYDPVVPLDDVIETARRVGAQMPRELRCTGLGGLSLTPASKAIEQALAARNT
jgi:L-serine dehydratase